MAQLSLLLVLLVSCFAIKELQGQQNEVETVGDADVTETEQENESSASGELTKRSDKTMTNIGYLFRGYHMLRGNPLDPSRKFDPGFKAKIFHATYKKNRRTDDQRWKIPDNVDIVGKQVCSISYSSETVTTESDYQRNLLAKASASASGNIKIVKASFSASAEYSRMSKILKSNTKSVIRTEAGCTVYEGSIQTGTPPKFTDNFLETVKNLQDQKNYGSFLDTFGTHFVEMMDMGARLTKLQEISKEKEEKLKKQGIDIKLAASISAAGIGGAKTERQLKISEEQTKKFDKIVIDRKTVAIGSKPSGKTAEEWVAKAIETPMPTYYKLRHIAELFTPTYFRRHKGIDYAKLKKQLTKYLEGYCKSLKSSDLPDLECEGPPKGCAGGSQCSFNAICNDNPNSGDKEQQYDCKCKPGFEGDGRICQKILKWQLGGKIEHEEERGPFGTWGGMETCKNGVFASGFSIRAQKSFGGPFYDDTGASAVCIRCDNTDVCSKKGQWGDWSGPYLCPKNSYLSGWKQNVERKQSLGKDDTALNNVEYKCRDIETWEETGEALKEKLKEWGKWSLYKECPKGFFICGINTRVEDSNGDNTGLNDIIHQCCKPLLKKKA